MQCGGRLAMCLPLSSSISGGSQCNPQLHWNWQTGMPVLNSAQGLGLLLPGSWLHSVSGLHSENQRRKGHSEATPPCVCDKEKPFSSVPTSCFFTHPLLVCQKGVCKEAALRIRQSGFLSKQMLSWLFCHGHPHMMFPACPMPPFWIHCWTVIVTTIWWVCHHLMVLFILYLKKSSPN